MLGLLVVGKGGGPAQLPQNCCGSLPREIIQWHCGTMSACTFSIQI